MKKTMITTLIFALSIVGVSCKREKEFEARGRVTNKITGEPIEGVKVILRNGLAGSITGNSSNPDVIDVAYTDANGFYHVKIKADHNHALLSPGKEGYEFKYQVLETDGSYNGFRSIGQGSHEIDMQMDGIAYFNSPFYKTSATQKDQDSLKISLLSYEKIDELLNNREPFLRKGKGVFYFRYEDSNTQVKGDRYLRYKLEFTTDGVWQTKIDSVFLPTSLEVYRDTIYY